MIRYDAMIEDIRKTSSVLEDGFFALQPEVEKRAADLYTQDPEKARAYITDYSNLMATGAVAEWWKLSDFLIMKYNDGYINVGGRERSAGYPKEWLDAVGYGTTKIRDKKK